MLHLTFPGHSVALVVWLLDVFPRFKRECSVLMCLVGECSVLNICLVCVCRFFNAHTHAGDPPFILDLSDRLVNDTILDLALSRWGAQLYELRLSRTYITDRGLSYLQRCDQLRSLHVDGCWNIVHKGCVI